MSDVTPSKAVTQVSPTDPKKGRSYESPEQKDAEGDEPPHEEAHDEKRQVGDIALVLGVPAADIPPAIQDGLKTVMNEFERQRRELESLRKRIVFLEKKYDTHPFLPIMSRYALESALAKVVNRSDQAQTENCFVCVQLEGLEAIRRSEGLPVADLIVTNTANLMKTELRASDIMGSMGGYGLGIIFTVTSFDGTEEKAEILVSKIERRLQETYVALRLVYGIHLIQPSDTVTQIFAAADTDLRKRR
ncbi:MAG: GGDEF domain-containing protein [Rhodospirillales bacterium]|jgi:diguanylate cyclase (GGDEF)-like protein